MIKIKIPEMHFLRAVWEAEQASRSWANRGESPSPAQMEKKFQYLELLMKAGVLLGQLADGEELIRNGESRCSGGRAIQDWGLIALGEEMLAKGQHQVAFIKVKLMEVEVDIATFDPAIKAEMDEKLKKLQATVGQ